VCLSVCGVTRRSCRLGGVVAAATLVPRAIARPTQQRRRVAPRPPVHPAPRAHSGAGGCPPTTPATGSGLSTHSWRWPAPTASSLCGGARGLLFASELLAAKSPGRKLRASVFSTAVCRTNARNGNAGRVGALDGSVGRPPAAPLLIRDAITAAFPPGLQVRHRPGSRPHRFRQRTPRSPSPAGNSPPGLRQDCTTGGAGEPGKRLGLAPPR